MGQAEADELREVAEISRNEAYDRMIREEGEASAAEWWRTTAAQRAASPTQTCHRLVLGRPVSPPRFPQSPGPRAVSTDTGDAGSQDDHPWDLHQLGSGADSGDADWIAGARTRRARADRDGPTARARDPAALPGLPTPAAPADPALSAHNRNEAQRLSQQLTTEMRARTAANDVGGTWSQRLRPLHLARHSHAPPADPPAHS